MDTVKKISILLLIGACTSIGNDSTSDTSACATFPDHFLKSGPALDDPEWIFPCVPEQQSRFIQVKYTSKSDFLIIRNYWLGIENELSKFAIVDSSNAAILLLSEIRTGTARPSGIVQNKPKHAGQSITVFLNGSEDTTWSVKLLLRDNIVRLENIDHFLP